MTKLNIDLKDVEDFKLVQVKIKDIRQITVDAWTVQLYSAENDMGINIIADIGQITSMLFGLSKTTGLSLAPSIHQFIKELCQHNNSRINSIIIDYIDDSISKAKIELQNEKGLVYFNMSSGDAVALALINQIPIYTMMNLLEEIEEDEDIEFSLE